MLKNRTKNSIISKDVKLLRGLFKKSLGLIGKNPDTVIFCTRFGIHTFGMKYPIDVLILDKGLKVINLKEKLKPNRIFLWNPLYKTVIELGEGKIDTSKTEINDILEFNL